MRREEDERGVLLASLATWYTRGGAVDWSGFHAHERRRRVPLPTYPFQRQRYWVEPRQDGRQHTGKRRSDVGSWFYAPVWRQAPPARPIAG